MLTPLLSALKNYHRDVSFSGRLATYRSESIGRRLHKRVQLRPPPATPQILVLLQHQTGPIGPLHPIRRPANAPHVLLVRFVVQIQPPHAVLKHRQEPLLEIQHPRRLLVRGAHLGDEAVVKRESEGVFRDRLAERFGVGVGSRVPVPIGGFLR